MRYNLSFESHAAPPAVLAAIHDQTREWRESVIPEALRRHHILRVVGRVRGNRFRLSYVRTEGGPDSRCLALEGVVEWREGGGSSVRARCGQHCRGWWANLLLPPVLLLLTGWIIQAIWLLALLTFLHVMISSIRREQDTDGRYLVERLEAALAAADAAARSSPTPAG